MNLSPPPTNLVSARRRIPDNLPDYSVHPVRSIRLTFLDFGRCYSGAALETLPELEALYLVATQDLLALENAKDFLETARVARQGRGRHSGTSEQGRLSVRSLIWTTLKSTWAFGLQAFSATTPKRFMKHGRRAVCWAPNSVLGRQLASLAKSIMTPQAVADVASEARGLDEETGNTGQYDNGAWAFFLFYAK